jgi:hypothetical protein
MSISDEARKLPGFAAAEGAIATEQDLPIADYDKQTADDIAGRLNGLSQRDLRMIDAYETKHETAGRSPTRSRDSPAKSRGRSTTRTASRRSRAGCQTRTPTPAARC